MTQDPAPHAPSAATLIARRKALADAVGAPILLMGHEPVARNFRLNVYPFRQDSTFLYYLGLSSPHAAAVIGEGGHTTLYLPLPEAGDALWHGAMPSVDAQAQRIGADVVRPRSDLAPGPYRTLPTADGQANAAAGQLVGREVHSARPETGDPELLAAVVGQRMCRDQGEVASIRRAAAVTSVAHLAGMSSTHVGVTENAVQAVIDGTFGMHGMTFAYPSIVTVRGEVLHGHAQGLALADGDLLLVDAGAEEPGGYASDVTRTWPVNGRFNPQQAAMYDLVLASQLAGIEKVRAGVRYRDVHMASSRVIAQGLVDEGLLAGDVDGLVEQGAHAVFFPHGVGHLLGLDVHDLELYGDIGYPAGRIRSAQFGLAYLRLDCDLQPGMVVTVEPGVYFVPEILHDAALKSRLGGAVRWSAAETWIGFGGIRIEDDVLVTDREPDVLTGTLPKERNVVEELVGSGLRPRERFVGAIHAGD